MTGLFEHVSDESDDVEAGESDCIAIVILHEPSAACGPGKQPFHNPLSGQQNEAALGLGQFDHFEPDPFGRGRLCRGLSRVALVNIGKGDRIAYGILNIGSQAGDSRTIADIGSCHVQGQQMAERIDRHVNL